MVQLNIIDNSLPSHLGGHENETHIDEGALKYLIDKFGIKTMIDVGCGPGGMVAKAREMGLDAYGVDGDFEVERDPEVAKYITIRDYSKRAVSVIEALANAPINDHESSPYANVEWSGRDLAWSVEFLEHVDAEYIYNFMGTFRDCKYVICTHALPGQPGHHHVNCREAPYWVDIFTAFGFEIDVETTNEVRNASTMAERYMRQQSLFFRNKRLT